MRRLVLWDIDLTLIDARGFGTRWYRKALAEVTGKDLIRMPNTAGRTELAITTDVLNTHGLPADDDTVSAMFTALTKAVEATREELAAQGSAMPGAAQALAHLASADGIAQTPVTGNLPEVAHHKLAAFDLQEHLDFGLGGFGHLSHHRHDLIADSVRKAEARTGRQIDAGSVVVVGDTPHDVAGALRFGAVAVGVATGGHTEEELRAAGAHHVLPHLADTERVLGALT
ncbi:HAD family hydrolase [Saccharopolyspora rectivirgula]|jgi:phosphoglycolate phosphatase|uniref:Haloacid dehalogenase n=1 Tax=Saccharopolyspora rectivirgula TaxID=28042 RepID=A0A073AZ76_9PSEU|nr:haloacid dehalogenase-like hydrolase [Saccharopolyspora rectivirgula]KEI44377.1 haloacid dehalogenase [Saccharopolyspora rectivirgula]